MVYVGQPCTLAVTKIVEFGAYFDAKELGEVLLPLKHTPAGLSVGDRVNLFIYLDSEGEPIATTQQPKACVGEFAFLKVAATTKVGAFLDWGLDKDLLVPFAEQHQPMKVGCSYLVYLYINRVDYRITASSKINQFIDDVAADEFKPRQEVDLIIANSTDMGYKAIVNNRYWGLLYKDEIFQQLSFGQAIKGFIKQLRPDGRIDLTLQWGEKSRNKDAALIEHYLQEHNGFAAVHDKSDPKLIKQLFGISKGAFKKAVGSLYKRRIITLEPDGIRKL
ncbi:MAG: GntR family transcriptional regulator [Gammaproteobacteria bacterium]|jgi:hypothetical protein|nr:GntR family transcriptional regulator [Gammaproteobacteria bacterium]MBT7023424.1 GntR family transcriptional regulator [Gammaproteobacteria bacterium]